MSPTLSTPLGKTSAACPWTYLVLRVFYFGPKCAKKKKFFFKVKIVSPELMLELFWCKIEHCVLKFLPFKTLKTFSKYVHRLLIEQNYKKIIWNLQRNKKIPPLPQFHVWLQSLKVVPCCTWRSNQKITSSFVFFSLLFFHWKKKLNYTRWS